jgi:RNA polymerase sigma factor (sigma-70 family)
MSGANANGAGVVRFIRDAAGTCADGEPDADLLRRFAADADEHAFRALVARHGPVVWAVCRRMLRNHHDAEDAFQATFLVLARGANGLRSGAVVGAWLCGVAARVSARLRSARRPEQSEAEPAVGHPDGALGDLTVREAEATLYEELARLPEKYRAPLVLCCLEGLTRDEAAARLGWTGNQVKHGLEHGREQLRARLDRRGVALGLTLLTSLLATPAGAVPPPVIDAAVRHATGTTPPAAVSSLAHGVNRAMWMSKWKWAVAGCAALVLTAGGTLAAILSRSPEPPAPPAKAGPNLVPAAEPELLPRIKTQAGKEQPKQPWDVAAEFLQLVLDGKTEQALKLADPGAVPERKVKEIQASGLKRVKFALVLINDRRVQVVTEKAKLVFKPGEQPAEGHVFVTLEREKPEALWVVRDLDVRDTNKLTDGSGSYLDGLFNFEPPAKEEPKPAAKPKAPSPAVDVATEFLTLALAGKAADALKLCVPGTISENKVGELRAIGYTGTKFTAVLINDTRVEVVSTEQKLAINKTEKIDAYLVLMLVKSKDGAWQAKDIDVRDEGEVKSRVELYLGGRYDEKPEKK